MTDLILHPAGGATGGTRLLTAIRQFTPNWFTVTMGTGILTVAINQFPYDFAALHAIGRVLWLLNILLFALFSGLYATRWMLFPNEARRIFDHSAMSMFFGAIPMGLATILNGFLAFGIPFWGLTAVRIAETLWWIDVAVACGVAVPFLMFTRQDHRIEKMTAIWLLPVVAAEVTAASGGLLAPHLAGAVLQYPSLELRTVGVLRADRYEHSRHPGAAPDRP